MKSLVLSHRYLFKEAHVDGDIAVEATVEEISPSGDWTKLRHFPAGTYEWKKSEELEVIEELSQLPQIEIQKEGLAQ
ncbi:MAG: hypothetical protein PHU23_00010 [Dehalococcoidales bacterium]|nr:hypothetical protein [Dehalococcoidales bacterium]